jgi:adenosine deaminase/adenosine deaminase CECR1
MCQRDAAADAADFNTNFVAKLHNDLKMIMNASPCAIKILFMEPVDLFKNLLLSLPIAVR